MRDLAGTIPGTSTVTGQIVLNKLVIAGTIPGTSTVTGQIVLNKLMIAGVIPGTSTVTGQIVRNKLVLQGAITGTSTLSGALKMTIAIRGLIAGTSTLAASLSGGLPSTAGAWFHDTEATPGAWFDDTDPTPGTWGSPLNYTEDFETSTGGWVGFIGGTVVRTTSESRKGSASLKITTDGSQFSGGAGPAIATSPSVSYRATAFIKAPAGFDWGVGFHAFDEPYTTEVTCGSTSGTGDGTWQLVTIDIDVPATVGGHPTAWIYPIAYENGESQPATTFYIDSFGDVAGSWRAG